jgi:hypothetical protein
MILLSYCVVIVERNLIVRDFFAIVVMVPQPISQLSITKKQNHY